MTQRIEIMKLPRAWAVLGGREEGRKALQKTAKRLAESGPDSVLEIDCHAVRLMDFSAADEFVGNLIRRLSSGELGSRRFYLSGLSDPVRESVSAVLRLRKLQCLERTSTGSVSILGDLSGPHRETLEYIIRHGEVTVGDLTENLPSKPALTAASNRLNTLDRAGLIVRMHGTGGRRGNRYVFRPILDLESPSDSPEQHPQSSRVTAKQKPKPRKTD